MQMNDELTPNADLDRTLGALADPTRRAILRHLMRGEARVTQLAAPFKMSLNAVSKHIQMLERAGLVSRRRVWREHLVSFNPAPLNSVTQWIEQTRAFWTSRLDALETLLRAEEDEASKPRKAARKKKGPTNER